MILCFHTGSFGADYANYNGVAPARVEVETKQPK